MTNALTPKSWFHTLYIHSLNETDSNSISGLEIDFLLDSRATKSVPNIPTYLIITELFIVSNPQ